MRKIRDELQLTLSTLEEDRNPFPTLVIDPDYELGESLGFTLLVEDGGIVEIGLLGWIGRRSDVLAEEDLVDSDGWYGFQEFDFGISEVVAVE